MDPIGKPIPRFAELSFPTLMQLSAALSDPSSGSSMVESEILLEMILKEPGIPSLSDPQLVSLSATSSRLWQLKILMG